MSAPPTKAVPSPRRSRAQSLLMVLPLIKRYQVEPVSLEVSEAEAGDVSKG